MDHWSLIGGTFLYCVGSAVIPVMHAEAYLIAVSALSPPGVGWALVIAATAGQMLGKVAMYGAGRGAIHLPSAWLRNRIARASAQVERQRTIGNALIFLSSSTGIPPFYFVSVAAGVLRVPLVGFIVFGSAGRFVRFAAAVFLPQLIRSWM
jgi:membrane protein YqaA with SNARE-associated domain